jgi:RHS repeat-associated protein
MKPALVGTKDDELLAVSRMSTSVFTLLDNQFTVRDAAAPTRRVTGEFNAFGQPLSSLPTRLGLTGREYNKANNLYDLRARWYDSSIGRFISADPLGLDGGDPNYYRYAFNAPQQFTDSFGLSALPEYGVALGVQLAILGGAASFNLYVVCSTARGREVTLLGSLTAVGAGAALGYSVGAGLIGGALFGLAAESSEPSLIYLLLQTFGKGFAGPAGSYHQVVGQLVRPLGVGVCSVQLLAS